ncbi:MAG: major facilitator family transporter [Chitinophagaceae bacterium]|nr:MAG: major facilitator family transporter [Chitinophagaceae bacterium]
MSFSTSSAQTKTSSSKPFLNFWQIWNMSFGFLGVQIGYSLQNANTSRILSAIGADPHSLSLFWLAAPMAGLIVQPIVGSSSDKTWTRLGRRIPYIFGGSIVSAIAMFFMPNSEHFASLLPALIFGAFMLLLMDTSFNVTMQPFRALVSDMVPEEQRNKGYAIQSFLINTGAFVGSMLPYVLTNIFHVANEPNAGEKVAPTVIWAFYFGGGALLLSVLWTSFKTKEYPPEEYAKYNNIEVADVEEKMSFLTLLKNIPATMWQLSITQFFSWFALFLMWVYTTQAIAQNIWGTTDPHSKLFNDAGDWTGVIFAAYSLFAALYSLVLTPLANKFGRKNSYMFSLICGGVGLISMLFIKDQNLLFIPMIGVGVAWAAILALPYAILSSSLPPKQTGVYMGIFNASITIPQIAAGLLGGIVLTLVGENAMNVIGIAGVSMILAGIFAKLFIQSKD